MNAIFDAARLQYSGSFVLRDLQPLSILRACRILFSTPQTLLSYVRCEFEVQERAALFEMTHSNELGDNECLPTGTEPSVQHIISTVVRGDRGGYVCVRIGQAAVTFARATSVRVYRLVEALFALCFVS